MHSIHTLSYAKQVVVEWNWISFYFILYWNILELSRWKKKNEKINERSTFYQNPDDVLKIMASYKILTQKRNLR